MTPPRILFVNHASVLSGAELVLADLAEAWPGASAFLFEDGPLRALLERRGLRVEHAAGASLAGLHRSASLLRALPLAGRLAALVASVARRARRHDLVYANSQKAFTVAAIASAAARRPLVWHLHDVLSPEIFGASQIRLQVRLANARAARVIVPSAAVAESFVVAGGRGDLVALVPNGLRIPPEPLPPAALRRALDLPEGPLVGVFSRLTAWKGQHVVLQALAALPGVSCLVVGGALFGERDYEEALARQAASPALAGRVRFLGHRDDVPRLMRAVDVVVHSSIVPEAFGRTLVEAMLAGVPVVATRTGAAVEVLDQGRSGTLVPPDDADALAAAVARVLAGAARDRTRLAAAAERAERLYGVSRMQQAVAAIVAPLARGAHA
ncbi:glycosyltransferase [Methylobacterium sp. JK268]